MAGVAQLVERWIVIPRPPSNISDLAPKAVRTNGFFAYKLRTNRKERMGDFTWRVSDCEELVGFDQEIKYETL